MKNIFFSLLILQIKNGTSAESSSNFKTEIYATNNVNHNSSKFMEIPEILGVPEALVRYKHNYPITIIKHKTRIRRRRPATKPFKPPKTKNWPPASFYGKPLLYKTPDNLYENHKSTSISFPSKARFNSNVGFYKELDPDFNFEDITFSEYEKQPIVLNFRTNKKVSRNRSKETKSNQEKDKMLRNWKDLSILNLEQPVDVLWHDEPVEVLWHKAPKYTKMLGKPLENLKSKKKQSSQEQYKINQKFYIPHSKYGIPTSEYNEEYEIPHNNIYHFAEPLQKINLPHIQYNKGKHISKTANKLNHNTESTKNLLEGVLNVDIITKPPLFVQPPEKKYNNYFVEPSSIQKNLKDETYILNYQQELPLQSETKLNFSFPKSSYDVPVYDSMPFRINEEQSNFPPLTNSHLIVEESQSSPSKISLTYAASNKTLIPLGYFNDNHKNNSKLFSFDLNQKYVGDEQVDSDTNKTRREFKNRNSNRIFFHNLTNFKKTVKDNCDIIKQIPVEIGLREKKKYASSSYSFNTQIPINPILLFPPANINPVNQISPLSWDPMKVNSYSFKIDHNNISSLISKTYDKSDEQIITTTTIYKGYKVKENEHLDSFSSRKSKSHNNSGKLTSKNLNLGNTSVYNENSKNSSQRNQFNLDYNFENLNIAAKIEKELKDLNLTLIQDPFDFNEKANSDKHQLRYRNHPYN